MKNQSGSTGLLTSLTLVHLYGETHVVAPYDIPHSSINKSQFNVKKRLTLHPLPPHCAHCAAPPVDAVVVAAAAVVVVVVGLTVVAPAWVVAALVGVVPVEPLKPG
jgi:hypothetical protein